MIKTEIVDITPEMATNWLKNNRGNRPLRRAVKQYAQTMQRGEWQLTHQGILFGKNDRLIDGQHRLEAIVMTGCTIRMMVSWDESLESPRGVPIDRGAPRDKSWVMGRTKRLWECATIIASLATKNLQSGLHNSDLTLNQIGEVAEEIETYHSSLTSVSARGFSMQAVRAAAVLAMYLSKTPDDVVAQYLLLVQNKQDGMWEVTKSFHRDTINRLLRLRGGGMLSPKIMLCKSFDAFTSTGIRRSRSKQPVHDPERVIKEACCVAADLCKEAGIDCSSWRQGSHPIAKEEL